MRFASVHDLKGPGEFHTLVEHLTAEGQRRGIRVGEAGICSLP